MNDVPQPPSVVPVDVAERIHQTCDRFEDAWAGATRPRLEFYLATAAEPERSWLLEELIALEVELRRTAGEQPTEAEYRHAFPGEADGKVIAAAFRRCADAQGETARSHSEVSGGATAAALGLRTLDHAAPVIEGYVILGILGRGGMGTVFLAEDNRLGRKVAIKTMRPELAAKAESRVRFHREAKAAAAIEHDNVVPIWQVGQSADGSPFMVMPFLQGETLESRLKREPVQPLGLVVHMAREIAGALAAAHARGLTHRDIKPANIWVEGDPEAKEQSQQVRRCKILDFGLARAADEDVQLTQSGAIVGTPAYVAPEQARGEKVDHRCDLFSMGCVLYRMATGKRPFNGDTTMALLLALAADTPQPVCKLNPNLPSRLARLIEALLAKKPAERPASANVVIAEIEAIQRELASPKDGATLEIALPAPAAVSSKRSRGPLVAVALGLMALFAAVVLGVVLLMPTPDGKVVRIECDDPDIKVAFEKGEFKVAGAYKDVLVLKPGKIGLKVKKGEDFEFETDKLIVHKGDRIVLKIEVVQGKVQIVQDGKGVLDSKELLEKRETQKVLLYNAASKRYLCPHGFHPNKPESRVSTTTVGRDIHETWVIRYTGEKNKRGDPVCTIESTNRECGAYKYMSVAGTVKGTKDPAVIGQMEVSLSNKPMLWVIDPKDPGTGTINLAHAGGYVVSVPGGICVLGWDADTPDQVLEMKPVK